MAQMPIPDDWDGETFCRWAVCWPNSVKWLSILDGLLTQPTRGRFWDASTGNIKNTQASFIPAYDENFILGEVIMACNDNGIAEALNAIATALASNTNSATATANCSGGGSCGCNINNSNDVDISIGSTITLTDGSKWPIYSDGPIPTIPESGFPDGYTDEPEYDADKCAKANKIISDLIVTLQNFAVLNLATGAIGAAVVLACLVGVITVPYVTIPLLLWAMVGSVGMTTAAGLMANYINDNREDFVCILYQENNLETMIGLLADLLDVAVAAIAVEGAVAIAIKSVVLWLLNGNTLGILLTSDSKLLFPEADCSGCGAPEETLQVYDSTGEWVETGWQWGEEVTFTPVAQSNGFYYTIIRIGFPGSVTPSNYSLAVSAISTNNNGNCLSEGSTPGTYSPQIEDGFAVWNFGCTNQMQPSLTGIFTKTT